MMQLAFTVNTNRNGPISRNFPSKNRILSSFDISAADAVPEELDLQHDVAVDFAFLKLCLAVRFLVASAKRFGFFLRD